MLGGISVSTQCTNSARGRSYGTVRSGLFTSSGLVGASRSTAVIAYERVPAGAPDHARCGLLLGPGLGPSAPGMPMALVAGTGLPSVSDLLLSCMLSSVREWRNAS